MQQFWILLNKAEALFGLDEMAAFETTKSEALAIKHDDWMLEGFDRQVKAMAVLIDKYRHILKREAIT
jgi:hypothetical protein